MIISSVYAIACSLSQVVNMSHPLLPERLPASVIAKLSGRSPKAVFAARKAGRLSSFATEHVEAWTASPIDPLRYLAALKATRKVRS